MARIALEHVDKIYPNGYVAARDLSLEAADGELLVLPAAANRRCFD
jgi:ABC-type sugar transport system ATPase subunit